MMKTFQSLFPPLAPHKLSLSSARRVVLISYNAERGTVDFRHYLITVKPYGVSKRIRRILDGAAAPSTAHSHAGVLDLGNEKDVADFLLRRKGEPGPSSDGYESAASSAARGAGDDGDAVDLADDYGGRNNKRGQKRAVKLDEIGPRMELRLIKVVEGLPGKEGGVLYHEFGTSISYVLRHPGAHDVLQLKNPRRRPRHKRPSTRPKKSSVSSGGTSKNATSNARNKRRKARKATMRRPTAMKMFPKEKCRTTAKMETTMVHGTRTRKLVTVVVQKVRVIATMMYRDPRRRNSKCGTNSNS